MCTAHSRGSPPSPTSTLPDKDDGLGAQLARIFGGKGGGGAAEAYSPHSPLPDVVVWSSETSEDELADADDDDELFFGDISVYQCGGGSDAAAAAARAGGAELDGPYAAAYSEAYATRGAWPEPQREQITLAEERAEPLPAAHQQHQQQKQREEEEAHANAILYPNPAPATGTAETPTRPQGGGAGLDELGGSAGERLDTRTVSLPACASADDAEAQSAGLATKRECNMATLQALCMPREGVRALHAAAVLAVEAGARSPSEVAAALVSRGYDAAVASSRSSGGGAASGSGSTGRGRPIFSGEHEFVRVTMPSLVDGSYEHVIVECNFRSQFAIARPMVAYGKLLDKSPDVYVGYARDMSVLVRFLVTHAAESFAAQGMDVPPWRKARAMLGKWLLGEARAAAQSR